MQQFEYTINDPAGFHARPAGAFVKKAKEFPCTVTISKDGKKADASKMFSLMGLGIKGGETIVVTTEGEQEQEAATALQAYLAESV